MMREGRGGMSRQLAGWGVVGILTTAVVASAAPAMAQQGVDTQSESAKKTTSGPELVERSAPVKLGVDLGAFTLYPSLFQTVYYDDNIFFTDTNTVDDTVSVTSPGVAFERRGDRHALSAEVSADVYRYRDNPSENYSDYFGRVEGRYDISPFSNIFGGALYSIEHESRESPDAVDGTEPTEYDNAQAYAGGFTKRDAWLFRLGGSFQSLDFKDTPSINANTIDNDDRDRDLYNGGLWVGYELNSTWTPFVQIAADIRRYDLATDNFGYDRDSDGYRASVGTRFAVGGNLVGEVFAGYMNQDYDDARLDTVTEPTVGLNVIWQVRPTSTLNGWIDRTIEETTLIDSSSYLYTSAGARFDQEITDSLTFNARYVFAQSDYNDVDREDYFQTAGVGLFYQTTPVFGILADYRYQQSDSSISGEDYSRNVVTLRGELRF